MKSPTFDMIDALSQLNKAEKKQLLSEMKFTYEQQLKTLKKGNIFESEYELQYCDAYTNMAVCYLRLGMYEDALEVSSRALQNFPGISKLLQIKLESLIFLFNFPESNAMIRKHAAAYALTNLTNLVM